MKSLNPGRRPNSKGKIEIHYGLRDFYKFYKNKYEDIVDYQVYAKIIKEINEEISNAIIYEGFEFKLPCRLGYLSIVKRKYKLRLDENGKLDTRYLPIDYKKTKELWAKIYPGMTEKEILENPDRKRVFITNDHSNKYMYQWYYNKFTSNAINKSVYFFTPTRTNKRNLSAYIKSEDFKNNYFEY